MTPAPSDNLRLARRCGEALGSPYCGLERREKLVIRAIVEYSFGLNVEWAVFPESRHLAVAARQKESHVSAALSSLKRMRIIQHEAADLPGFRRPMRYRVLVDELVRISREPTSPDAALARTWAANAAWLIHVNRLYPLQPELLAPEPNELADAIAELSRASVLAVDPRQNGEPKPGHDAREAYPPEPETRPGLASHSEERPSSPLTPPPGGWMDPAEVHRLMAASLATAGHPHPALAEGEKAGFEIGALVHALEAPPVTESVTGNPEEGPLVTDSVTACARASDHLMSDGKKDLSIRNPDKGMQGEPVTNPVTDIVPPLAIEAAMLLSKHGVEWTPPTAAQQVFDELLRCMGGAMANYSHWWWPKCRDPRTRRDVLEAIATWRLASIHPNHKPWLGGAWKNEFHRRQRARLEAERSVAG